MQNADCAMQNAVWGNHGLQDDTDGRIEMQAEMRTGWNN
jgi:hypothetical protein